MCCTFIMYSIIILHSCKGNTHPLPPSIIYVYKECICIDCFIHWTQEIQSIDKWTEAICTLMMKTVLVLTLLAVTIACCYARPAERANEPYASWQASHSEAAEHLSKWLTFKIVLYWIKNYFFYILGMKQPEQFQIVCFHQPDCLGPPDDQLWPTGEACCRFGRGRSYYERLRCIPCPLP